MKYKTSLALFMCLVFTTALAAEQPPLAMVHGVTNQVLAALNKNKSQLQNKKVIYKIVNNIIVPHFDMDGVSRSVVGRNYWYQATDSQRSQFITLFTRYVTDMYASAIAAYSNETISFQPLRDYNPGQSRAQVYSTIERPAGSNINLNYRVVNISGNWKIYDFSVDGISMVQSYRSQFTSTLNQGGLSKLNEMLAAKERG
jgi:phospholipid transport system substrate-binding protein